MAFIENSEASGKCWLLPYPQGKIDGIHGELPGFKVSASYFPFLKAKLMTFMENSQASR